MIVRVAVIGPAKDFFAVLKENLCSIYPAMSWLEFDDGFEFISYCLTCKELPNIDFVEALLLKIDGTTVSDYLSSYFPEICVICVVEEIDSYVISNLSEVGVTGVINRSDANALFKIIDPNTNPYRIVQTSLSDIGSIRCPSHNTLVYYRATIFEKYGITKRESLFLLLNATGLEYGEIAKLMFISRKTVDNLFHSVAKKFGVHNRHNLTLFCFRMRLTKISMVKNI